MIERAVLLVPTFKNYEKPNFEELERLAHTAGLEVVYEDSQFVREVSPATLFGSGKLEKLASKIPSLKADVVIIDHELTGSQTTNISNMLNVKVIDRIALILDIFAQRATTQEGKLQVELAQLKYILPRLSSIEGTSGRFGSAGVGMRGPGETQLETDKRIVRDRISRLSKEIIKIKKQRDTNRKKRKAGEKKRVAIVGYTNSGKSTLLNKLSKANIYADDKLFATLETTSKSVWLGDGVSIILTDTVGFISNLPHSLVDAFASTLEEASEADLILHVVDISNPDYKSQMSVTEKTLEEIGAGELPTVVAYNKCDKIHPQLELRPNEVFVSATTGKGIEELKELIKQMLK